MIEKSVSQSRSEQQHIIMSEHINGRGRLFGGRLVEWADTVAAVVARRHSGNDVTTLLIENLLFEHPAHINDTIVLKGFITYAGRTSMEICVETFVEALDGAQEKINTAYFVMVALDENEKPVEVPRLVLESSAEREQWALAEERRNRRKGEL